MVVEPLPAAQDFMQVWTSVRGRYDALVVERLGFRPPLHEVATYALRGGKRLRPLLAELVGRVAGARAEAITEVAVSVEYLHTASVLLDDLRCMDDARERRGQPPAHVRFSEAQAILAAVALVSRAYACLIETPVDRSEVRLSMARLACETVAVGMAPGQALELGARAPDSADAVRLVHAGKTASLFQLTAQLSCLCGEATEELSEKLARFAALFGRAYQIVDDVADREEPGEGHANLARAVGARAALSEAKELLREARSLASADPDGGLEACVDWLRQWVDRGAR